MIGAARSCPGPVQRNVVDREGAGTGVQWHDDDGCPALRYPVTGRVIFNHTIVSPDES